MLKVYWPSTKVPPKWSEPSKLSNKNFVTNAPEKVVYIERKKVADAKEKITLLEKSLASL